MPKYSITRPGIYILLLTSIYDSFKCLRIVPKPRVDFCLKCFQPIIISLVLPLFCVHGSQFSGTANPVRDDTSRQKGGKQRERIPYPFRQGSVSFSQQHVRLWIVTAVSREVTVKTAITTHQHIKQPARMMMIMLVMMNSDNNDDYEDNEDDVDGKRNHNGDYYDGGDDDDDNDGDDVRDQGGGDADDDHGRHEQKRMSKLNITLSRQTKLPPSNNKMMIVTAISSKLMSVQSSTHRTDGAG